MTHQKPECAEILAMNAGRIVKIVRNGERFWLRNARPLNGTMYGQVDNHLLENPPYFGQIIQFDENEIIDEIKE